MQHLALLSLEDHEVDLLSRVRLRDDVRLGAVYHPDPSALVIRLAGLARVPVVFDIEALAALPIDFCVGGEKAASAVRELIGRAAREGKPVPIFVPTDDFDAYLRDPAAYVARRDAGVEAAPGGKPEESPRVESVLASVNWPDIDTEGPTAEFEVPDFARSDAPDLAIDPEPPVEEEPMPAPPPPPESAAPPATVIAIEAEPQLGTPPISDLYDPIRLSRWLVETALRGAGGSAAVLWRRESEGQRYSLMSFAPGADQLPTIAFPPAELESYVATRDVRVVDPPRSAGSEGSPSSLKLLSVPLGGDRGPFGLLGVFRPAASGDFPEDFKAEIASQAYDFGVALERSVQFAGMGQELRSLRFKERVRDLMLDTRTATSERWSRLLDFLILETQADFAQFLRVSDDGARLSLEAASGLSGDFEGWVSIPVGRGMLGRAVERDRVIVYTGDDDMDDRGIFLLPVRSGREADARAIGLLVLDGAANMNAAGEDTAVLLQTVADIVSPLLKSPPGGRA